MADGCPCGRNASQGEATAYQASYHRLGAGLDSVQLPEQRAVRALLACNRYVHASQPHPHQGYTATAVDGG